jgi:hypothetical protein
MLLGEIFHVRYVLEEVGVDGAIGQRQVGLYVIGEFDQVQFKAGIGGQVFLDEFQDVACGTGETPMVSWIGSSVETEAASGMAMRSGWLPGCTPPAAARRPERAVAG